jgi:hypothetical protein
VVSSRNFRNWHSLLKSVWEYIAHIPALIAAVLEVFKINYISEAFLTHLARGTPSVYPGFQTLMDRTRIIHKYLTGQAKFPKKLTDLKPSLYRKINKDPIFFELIFYIKNEGIPKWERLKALQRLYLLIEDRYGYLLEAEKRI